MLHPTCPQPLYTTIGSLKEERSVAVSLTLVRLRAALDDYRFSPDSANEAALRQVVRELAKLIETWPSQESDSATVRELLQSARVLWASEMNNRLPPLHDFECATQALKSGWPGLLASMLLTPAWAWEQSPRLAKVPDWLWGDFMHWVLTPPLAPAKAGTVDRHFCRITPYLEELAGWMERNRGSSAVRAGGEAFLDMASSQQPQHTTIDLKKYATVRARLLRAIARTRAGDIAQIISPHVGRPLRVGLVARIFGDDPETQALLAVLQKLDPHRVDLVLLTATTHSSPCERQFRQLTKEFRVLPATREARLQMCGQAACDVLLYAADLVGTTDEFTGLALQRLAPVQGVLAGTSTTTGLGEIDLRFIGAETVEPSSERLALLPGAGRCFVETGRSITTESVEPCREEFGLPAEGPVFVSAARAELLSAEILETWAALLTSMPDASLLLIQPTSADPFLAEELQVRMERLAGINPSRVVVSLDDRRRGFAVGDVYLDCFPTADSAALVDALRAGLPVLTWSGQTHRSQTSAAVLIGLRATDQVAVNGTHYLEIARRLAVDVDFRGKVKAVQQENLAADHDLSDSLALADALTALLENHYDEMAAGSDCRRASQSPVRLGGTADEVAAMRSLVVEQLQAGDAEAALAGTWKLLALAESSADARALHAQALRLNGRNERALTYALAALNGNEQNAERWVAVAELLHANNQAAEAIEAYEAALKIDATRVDAWTAISELAAAAGHHEFAAEAISTVRALNPDHARLADVATTG